MKNIWKWLWLPVDIIALTALLQLGIKLWQATLIVFIPAFVYYIDGLRDNKNK